MCIFFMIQNKNSNAFNKCRYSFVSGLAKLFKINGFCNPLILWFLVTIDSFLFFVFVFFPLLCVQKNFFAFADCCLLLPFLSLSRFNVLWWLHFKSIFLSKLTSQLFFPDWFRLRLFLIAFLNFRLFWNLVSGTSTCSLICVCVYLDHSRLSFNANSLIVLFFLWYFPHLHQDSLESWSAWLGFSSFWSSLPSPRLQSMSQKWERRLVLHSLSSWLADIIFVMSFCLQHGWGLVHLIVSWCTMYTPKQMITLKTKPSFFCMRLVVQTLHTRSRLLRFA